MRKILIVLSSRPLPAADRRWMRVLVGNQRCLVGCSQVSASLCGFPGSPRHAAGTERKTAQDPANPAAVEAGVTLAAPEPLAWHHDLETFDSGVDSLNRWLRRHALKNQAQESGQRRFAHLRRLRRRPRAGLLRIGVRRGRGGDSAGSLSPQHARPDSGSRAGTAGRGPIAARPGHRPRLATDAHRVQEAPTGTSSPVTPTKSRPRT